MHRTWTGLAWLGAALLGLAGCATQQKIRPPKPPEEYVLPPNDDARFSEHIRYPKSTLFGESIKRGVQQPQQPMGPLQNPGSRMGGRPGGLY